MSRLHYATPPPGSTTPRAVQWSAVLVALSPVLLDLALVLAFARTPAGGAWGVLPALPVDEWSYPVRVCRAGLGLLAGVLLLSLSLCEAWDRRWLQAGLGLGWCVAATAWWWADPFEIGFWLD